MTIAESASIKTIGDLCQIVWSMEQAGDLFSRSINNVFYWPIIRPLLILRLGIFYGLHDAMVRTEKQSFLRRVATRVAVLVRSIDRAPFPLSDSFDTIVFPSPRRQAFGALWVDILSEQIRREPALGRVLVMDRASDFGLYANGENWTVRCSLFINSISAVVGRVALLGSARSERAEYRILADMAASHGIALPFSEAKFILEIASFAASRRLYRSVIKRSGAKQVFIVARGGLGALLAAAEDVGIQSIEMQHGTLSRYQPYHFPGRPYVPYEPNFVLTWGEAWAEGIDLARNTTAFVVGSENVAAHAEASSCKVSRQVLVLSQGTIGRRLFDTIAQVAAQAAGWSFLFRPHTWEDFEYYRNAIRALNLPNLRISEKAEDVYALLARTDVQIGVYSTALFEGMALGARTIVLNLPGAEHMEKLIARGDAALARDSDEIIKFLPTAPRATSPERYFAKPRSFASILRN